VGQSAISLAVGCEFASASLFFPMFCQFIYAFIMSPVWPCPICHDDSGHPQTLVVKERRR
jgi:hypothetical protein